MTARGTFRWMGKACANALFEHFPTLATRVPWVRLGDWPTPVEPLAGHENIFVKREDLSSTIYGGNKLRTLEPLFGKARALGAQSVWATGAFGSSHAAATALHARRHGFVPGAALYPQPPCRAAGENLRATLTAQPHMQLIPHAALLPTTMVAMRRRADRRGERMYLMPPGGATPTGALGAVAAGLELADQIQAGRSPLPFRIVLAVGSTCTTAGLLVGLLLARRLGRLPRLPHVHAVRVTPWPITSPVRIARLAHRTTGFLQARIGPIARFAHREIRQGFSVDRRFIGAGYGRTTHSGLRAIADMAAAGGPPLDTVYSAKSGAALFDVARLGGPTLYWATRSSAPLPSVPTTPPALASWLARC